MVDSGQGWGSTAVGAGVRVASLPAVGARCSGIYSIPPASLPHSAASATAVPARARAATKISVLVMDIFMLVCSLLLDMNVMSGVVLTTMILTKH